MTTHIFAIGDRVRLNAALRSPKDSAATFIVKNRLPHVGTQLQYRIKAEAEPHDRVVTEGQLSRVAGVTGEVEPMDATPSTDV